jgi:hypothetical protein
MFIELTEMSGEKILINTEKSHSLGDMGHHALCSRTETKITSRKHTMRSKLFSKTRISLFTIIL